MAERFRRTKEEIALGLSAEEAALKRKTAVEADMPPMPPLEIIKEGHVEKKKKKRRIKKKLAEAVEETPAPEVEETVRITEAASKRIIKKLAAAHEIKPKELKKSIEATIDQRMVEFLDMLSSGVEYRAVDHRDHKIKNLLTELEEEKWIFAFRLLDGSSLVNYYVYMRIKQ